MKDVSSLVELAGCCALDDEVGGGVGVGEFGDFVSERLEVEALKELLAGAQEHAAAAHRFCTITSAG